MGVMTAWAIGNSREAERQREAAIDAKIESDKQRINAENERDRARQLLYGLKIRSAQNFINRGLLVKASEGLLDAPIEFRNFEWGHLMKKSNQSLIDLHGHTQMVYSANYSPEHRAATKVLQAELQAQAQVVIK